LQNSYAPNIIEFTTGIVAIGEAHPLKKPYTPSVANVELDTDEIDPPLIYILTLT
jgi:hypothetical protein